MTEEQSTKRRRGSPAVGTGKYDLPGARFWRKGAVADAPDIPMPDLSVARPLTEEEGIALVSAYCTRPSSRTSTGRVSLQVAYHSSSVLRSRYFFPLIVSGLRGEALIKGAIEATIDAPRSYTLHYMPKVFFGFCRYFDLITEEQYRSWRQRLPSYVPAKKAQDLVLTPTELRKYFAAMSSAAAADPQNYYAWRDYFAASTSLLTGCREGQILKLRWPFDVEYTPESITFHFHRQKSARSTEQVHHINPSTVLPSGDTFAYVMDNLIATLPYSAQGLYVSKSGDAVAHVTIDSGLSTIGRRISLRAMRATAASVVAHTMGIFQAKEMLGHSNVATTMQYVKSLPINNTVHMANAISQYSGETSNDSNYDGLDDLLHVEQVTRQ